MFNLTIRRLPRYEIFAVFLVLIQFNDPNIGGLSRYVFHGIQSNLKIPILGDCWYCSISHFNFNFTIPYGGTVEIQFLWYFLLCASKDFLTIKRRICILEYYYKTTLCLMRQICVSDDYAVSSKANLYLERLYCVLGDEFVSRKTILGSRDRFFYAVEGECICRYVEISRLFSLYFDLNNPIKDHWYMIL